MRARLFPHAGMIIGFMVIMLFVAALPPSQAASRSIGPSVGGATVTGRVFITGAQPAIDTYVSLAPVLQNNVIDYNNSSYTYTDNTGAFTFTDVQIGDYSMDIQPYCISDVLPLIDNRFSVSTIAPVNRGSITLPPAVKHISGKVTLKGTTTAQSNVYVNAYNYDTSNFACAYTNSAGAYTLGVTGGNWEVSISPQPGARWMFTQTAPVVAFANDINPETHLLDLLVQPTDGFLTGRVLAPNGNPLPLPAGAPPAGMNYSASVDIWNDDTGSYTYAYLDATGTFTLPVVSDRYNASVWVSQYDYPDYASPPHRTVEVGNTTLNLGDLRLEARGNKHILGVVRDNQAQAVPYAYVQAYESDGRFIYDQTAIDGSYDLHIPDGVWDVDVYPPTGSTYLNINTSKVISTTQDINYPHDFVLTQATTQIYGKLVDQQGQPVTDVDAWAYARTDDPATWDVVSISTVTNGSFVLDVPDGALKVGIYLAPNSDYSLTSEISPAALSRRLAASQSLSTVAMAQLEQSAYEQAVTIPPAGVGSAQVAKSVQLTLARNDATISGKLIDQQTGAAVTGVSGVVIAAPDTADAYWQWADLQSDGSYTLKLAAGTWHLSYSLDGEQYNPYSADSIVVQALAGQTVTQNLTTTRLDGVIEGVVVDAAGQPIPSTYIWVRGTNFEQYAATDEHGAFTVYVPLKDGANLASYSVGTALSCDAVDTCQLDAEPQTVVATARIALGNLLIAPQNTTTVLVTQRPGPAVLIQGIITNNGSPAKDAKVNFTPKPGWFASTFTKNDGQYTLNVNFPAGTTKATYKLEAGYLNAGAFTAFGVPQTGTVSVSSALRAAQASQQLIELPLAQLDAAITLPERVSEIFQASDGWSYTLSDGSQIQIPANTVPITPTSQVQVVVEATPLLQPTSLYAMATYYGYTITLYDVSSGKQITGSLRSDALLTLRYDTATLAKRGTSEEQIRPASFSDNLWQPASKFIVNPPSNKVTVQTRTLGAWALVQPQNTTVMYLSVMRH